MTAGDGYKDCCWLSAKKADATFCPECGHPLYRCVSPDCPGLVSPLGHCPLCIQPVLYVEKGAVLVAEKDECLTIPFVLRNNSPVNCTLSIQNLFRYGKDEKTEPIPIGWEKLEAGRERTFSVQTEPFTGSGTIRLGIMAIVASRVEGIQELYAFAGEMRIDVERGSVEPTQITQTFNMDGANLGTGAMVYASQKQADSGLKKRQAEALQARLTIPLERQDRYELDNGYRGYKASRTRIARDVEFVYDGFQAHDKPPDGPLLKPMIRCGRNGRDIDAQKDSLPNDLSLRIYDPKSGELDERSSNAISRNVCEFVLQNDRLYVKPIRDKAIAQNGVALNAGDAVVVNHGDSFTVPVKAAKAVTFSTKFRVTGDEVKQIRFEMGKNPARN